MCTIGFVYQSSAFGLINYDISPLLRKTPFICPGLLPPLPGSSGRRWISPNRRFGCPYRRYVRLFDLTWFETCPGRSVADFVPEMGGFIGTRMPRGGLFQQNSRKWSIPAYSWGPRCCSWSSSAPDRSPGPVSVPTWRFAEGYSIPG